MRIYTGNVFADLILPPRNKIAIFEDLFAQKVAAEYPACWDILVIETEVICKTRDAIQCAPEDATIVRIGRSVRKSDFGQIIETEMTLSEYLFVDNVAIDRRQN